MAIVINYVIGGFRGMDLAALTYCPIRANCQIALYEVLLRTKYRTWIH